MELLTRKECKKIKEIIHTYNNLDEKEQEKIQKILTPKLEDTLKGIAERCEQDWGWNLLYQYHNEFNRVPNKSFGKLKQFDIMNYFKINAGGQIGTHKITPLETPIWNLKRAVWEHQHKDRSVIGKIISSHGVKHPVYTYDDYQRNEYQKNYNSIDTYREKVNEKIREIDQKRFVNGIKLKHLQKQLDDKEQKAYQYDVLQHIHRASKLIDCDYIKNHTSEFFCGFESHVIDLEKNKNKVNLTLQEGFDNATNRIAHEVICSAIKANPWLVVCRLHSHDLIVKYPTPSGKKVWIDTHFINKLLSCFRLNALGVDRTIDRPQINTEQLSR